MGKTYAGPDKRLAEFIRSQHVFFVATAPPGSGGHVHLLPRGSRDTFAVLGPSTFAYLDLTDRIEHNTVSVDGLPALS